MFLELEEPVSKQEAFFSLLLAAVTLATYASTTYALVMVVSLLLFVSVLFEVVVPAAD